MMTNVSEQQKETKPISRDATFALRAPTAGNFLAPASVMVAPTAHRVEWLNLSKDAAKFHSAEALLEASIQKSQRIAERYPESARAHTNLAQAFWQSGNVDQAGLHSQLALDRDPENYVAALLLARVREAEGRSEDARDLYRLVVSKHAEDVAALSGLANAEIRIGNFESAQAYLQKVIRSDPRNGVAFFTLGMVSLGLKRPKDAIDHFKKAAELDLRSPILHNALGLAYWSNESLKRAEREFRTAHHLLPSYAGAVRSLAHLLILRQRPAEAVSLLREHLTSNKESESLRDLLGWALFETGEYKRAIGELKRALELAGSSSQALGQTGSELARIANNIGVAYSRLREWNNSEHWYARSISLGTSAPTAFHNLARLYAETRHLDRAYRVLDGVPSTIRDTETDFLLAWIESLRGHGQDAIRLLDGVIRREDAGAPAFSLLGSLLTDEADRPDLAVSILRSAITRFPNEKVLTNNFAYALLMAGATEEARSVLGKYPEEGIEDVFLSATWGLLHLREGHLAEGVAGYVRAQQLAQQRGLRSLAQQAKQKMHVELARLYREQGDLPSAQREIRLGLAVEGRPNYARVLKQLKAALPETSEE
jgi:tetratricopeptide (TPR) repeat protein